MKKYTILFGLVSMISLFSLNNFHASADAYVTTPIIDQILHPERGDRGSKDQLNNNGPRNWEMNDGKFNIQQTQGQDKEITYHINSTDPYYQNLWKQAVSSWNNLGVIKFVPVESGQQITLKGNGSDRKQTWLGNTTFGSMNDDNDSKYSYMIYTVSQLSGRLSTKSNAYKMNLDSATHELGHALGFAHDDSRIKSGNKYYYHIMDTSSTILKSQSTNQLGDYEKQTLLKYYQ